MWRTMGTLRASLEAGTSDPMLIVALSRARLAWVRASGADYRREVPTLDADFRGPDATKAQPPLPGAGVSPDAQGECRQLARRELSHLDGVMVGVGDVELVAGDADATRLVEPAFAPMKLRLLRVFGSMRLILLL
jgi:hypothetical protein